MAPTPTHAEWFVTTKPLARVRWSDAHGNTLTTYEAHEVPHAPALVDTFGVVIRQDAIGITIASEVFEAGSFRGVTFIPAAMVVEIQYYHAPRGRRKRQLPDPGPAPSAQVVSGSNA